MASEAQADKREFETGAVRNGKGKGRCDLLPHSALLRISRHMENSLGHYEERNWEQGMPISVTMDSAMRHIFKYMDGWDDEDHLAAAATNLLMALWTEDHYPRMQDIPSRPVLTADSFDDKLDEADIRDLARGMYDFNTTGQAAGV